MKDTKLVKILKRITPKDRQKFAKFLASPYFNARAEIITLYEYLVQANQTSHGVGEKRDVWDQIFPGKVYSDQKMRLLISQTFKLLEKYLINRQLEQDHLNQQRYLTQAFSDLRMEVFYQKSVEFSRKTLNKQTYRDIEYLQKRYELELEQYQYLIRKRETKSNDWQGLSNSLDAFYLASKLKQACYLLSYKFVFKRKESLPLMAFVLDYIQEHTEVLSNPAISIYYNAYQTMQAKDPHPYFLALKRDIVTHYLRFDSAEMRDLYIIALNFCIRRMNAGQEIYEKETFELYKEGIERKYLFEHGRIAQQTFSNVVFSGILLEAFEWVQDFIEAYHTYLPKENQKNIYSLTAASLQYHQQNYGGALGLLNQFDASDPILGLKERNLRLKIYFEIGEFELLESHINSMNAFLNRKDIATRMKTPYQSFLRLTLKLVRQKFSPDFDSNALRQNINELSVRPLREWLLAQLEK